jgi:nucleoside-diphosphate-sugar epimerase
MKKAVVLGASGGMGYALVNELTERGIETVAFARTKEKLQKLYHGKKQTVLFDGNAFSQNDLLEATKEADVIFHAINIPYRQWPEKLPALMKNVLETAQVNNAKVVIVDNIYAYGRSNGQKVKEDTPKQPHTKKGKIRLNVENMAKEAHKNGIPILIAHFPDFYGPNAENTFVHYTLQSVLANKKAAFVGNQKIKREFIFTPDGAKALVELALRDSAYGQNWNIPACGVISGEEMIGIIRDLTGYDKPVGTVGKGMMFFAGLLNPDLREALEMMYLTEDPVILSGEKYEKEIGPIPKTSYEEGLRKTIEFMRQNH